MTTPGLFTQISCQFGRALQFLTVIHCLIKKETPKTKDFFSKKPFKTLLVLIPPQKVQLKQPVLLHQHRNRDIQGTWNTGQWGRWGCGMRVTRRGRWENFKSLHLAITDPSLPGVSTTFMPLYLDAKFLPFWCENPGLSNGLSLLTSGWRDGGTGCGGRGPGLADGGLCFS